MYAMIELAEFRRQDIIAEAARYRLAEQAVPDKSTASMCSDIPSLVLRVVQPCGRIWAALLATASRSCRLRGVEQDQTALTAVH